MLRHLLPGVVALLCVVSSYAQSIKFKNGRVMVDNLDGEVLYTFARYHNKPEVWREVFMVRVKGAALNIGGAYVVGDSSVYFEPSFPFAPGVDYEAMFDTEQLARNPNEVYNPQMDDRPLAFNFRIDELNAETPSIVAVFPTADELPENLLRFHIEFSVPMTIGEVYKRVKLFDEQGKEVEKAILIVDEELWDNDMRSVTVMLDPGRIKRGLRANVEMNAPLISGRSYSLVVEKGWKSSNGKHTAKTFVKKFRCHAADRSRPLPKDWHIIAPKHHNGSLVIRMNEPFDIVLLRNSIIVNDALGNRVEGRLSIPDNERGIVFTPGRPWSNQQYSILINPALEDLAGNKATRLFDVDVTQQNDLGDEARSVTVTPIYFKY